MIVLFLALMCCLTAPAEVEVTGDAILLGDLIEFPVGDRRADVSLGYAPNPGLARRLQDFEILGKLRSAGLPSDDLKLPEAVLVRRASQRLTEDSVRVAVERAFASRFPDASVELVELTIPIAEIATGPIDVSAALPSNFSPNGPISIRLDVGGAGFSRSLFARAQVRISVPQPVLTRSVEAHSPVQESDVAWIDAPLGNRGDVVTSLRDVRGLLAKRDLAEGDVLSDSMLYAPVLVKRGDPVTVQATAGNVSIAAVMKARSSGQYGDTIIVEHLDGGGRASARVVGPGTVEAILGRQR